MEVPRIPSLNTYAFLSVLMRTLQFKIFTKQKEGLQLHRKKTGYSSIVEGLTDKVLGHKKPYKNDISCNTMGDSVHSTFQKVQRVHELEFSYASSILSLRYHLYVLYTDYYSTKKCPKNLCYVNTMLL